MIIPYLIIDIEQGEVIPTRSEEVGTCIISKDDAVLWSVEDGVVDREHGSDAKNLLTAAIPMRHSV